MRGLDGDQQRVKRTYNLFNLKTLGAIGLFMAAIMTNPVFAQSGPESDTAFIAATMAEIGRPVGLIHLPRCADATLLAALAQHSGDAQIHAQHPDLGKVAEARKALDKTGLLGRRIMVDLGDTSRLLPVGHSCDLVLMTDLAEQDLTPGLAAEIARVLQPWYGVAVLGDLSGRLSLSALEEWARRIPGKISAAKGAGAILHVQAPPLKGADNWPMWWHGPDNNAVSSDTAYAMDESFQWAGKPLLSAREDLPIVADGRLFMLWNATKMGKNWIDGMPLARLEGEGPFVTAHATGSGQILWALRLSKDAWGQASRSAMVADGDRLLVADGGTLLELEAATGKERNRVETGSEEIRWLCQAGDKALFVGGFQSKVLGVPGLTEQVIPFRSGGLSLTALDRETLKKAWEVIRQPGPTAFDPRSAAVSVGRVFMATENGTVEAFNLADGAGLWQTPTDTQRAQPIHLDWDFTAWNPVTGFAVEGVYVYSATEMRKAYVFDQENGHLLWSVPTRKESPFIPLAIDGRLHRIDRMSGGSAFNPRTGEKTASPFAVPDVWCARVTASPHGIFAAEGQRMNLKTGALLPAQWRAKSSCTVGSFVANGLLWKVPLDCKGCTQWLGILARGQRESAPAPPERLIVSRQLASDDKTAAGWVTYRGNMERSGSSPADIASTAKIIWQTPPAHPPGVLSTEGKWSLDVEINPTAPVTSGETVVVGQGDGAVEAFNLTTGQRRWRSPTGGRIYSSPTIWRDRVFVGCADGYLYCFALADGQELWRLRVAPDVGRMMLYGQAGSRWPVLGSPLVAGDKVVATAGLVHAVDGIWAAAADPVAGGLRWQQHDWSGADPGGELSGAGQLCLQGETIAFHGGAAPLVRMSSGDGAIRPAWQIPDEVAGKKLNIRDKKGVNGSFNMYLKGQEIGALSGNWLVCGGALLIMDQSWSGLQRTEVTFVSSTAPKGLPLVRARDMARMPVWDDEGFLAVIGSDRKTEGLALIPREKLVSKLDAAAANQSPMNSELASARNHNLPSLLLSGIKLGDEDLFTWKQEIPNSGKDKREVFGTMLTRNGACLLWHVPGASLSSLSAYDRKTGQEKWTIKLPSTPLREGLAVAANGALLVSMKDGSLVAVK